MKYHDHVYTKKSNKVYLFFISDSSQHIADMPVNTLFVGEHFMYCQSSVVDVLSIKTIVFSFCAGKISKVDPPYVRLARVTGQHNYAGYRCVGSDISD